MPEQADKLMQENMSKNLIDQDEYPMTRAFPSYLEFITALIQDLTLIEILHARCLFAVASSLIYISSFV
jgi:hypothetical protein